MRSGKSSRLGIEGSRTFKEEGEIQDGIVLQVLSSLLLIYKGGYKIFFQEGFMAKSTFSFTDMPFFLADSLQTNEG
jgi:hypothetical protein